MKVLAKPQDKLKVANRTLVIVVMGKETHTKVIGGNGNNFVIRRIVEEVNEQETERE